MRTTRLRAVLLLTFMVFAYDLPTACAQNFGIPTWKLRFNAPATGGTLILARNLNRTAHYITLATSQRESPESVVERLADVINRTVSGDTERADYQSDMLWTGGNQVSVSDGALVMPLSVSDWLLAGTETGLGIPEPPSSLTYAREGDKVVLRWLNSSTPYDSVFVMTSWDDFSYQSHERLPGSSESFTVDLAKLPINLQDAIFRVMGVRADVPSNAASIHVSGASQAELDGLPFTNNVVPNWRAWTAAERINESRLEWTPKYAGFRGYVNAQDFVVKPFYQTLKGTPGGTPHGIYRKFLGLTPDHTYRISTCVNTLKMDSISSPWTFSLCATPDPPASSPDGTLGSKTKSAVRHLTREQMAGTAALPDDSQGPGAGVLFSYSPGRTTNDQFRLVFTGEKGDQENTVSHITLPAGVTSITVWLRFACADPQGAVAFSGIMLEDITANPNPLPPEVIRHNAYKSEEQLMRGMAERMER